MPQHVESSTHAAKFARVNSMHFFIRGAFGATLASSLVSLAACGTPSVVADSAPDSHDGAPIADVIPMDAAVDVLDDTAPDVVSSDTVADVPATDVPPTDGLVDALADVPVGEGCGDASLCDGTCVDTSTDPHHCGGCENDCSVLAHVTGAVTCTAGACVLTGACAAGFGDCDGDANNGCETSLTDAAHCGACGIACSGATPTCASGSAGYACASACPVATEIRCADACIDPVSDPAHCGNCETSCLAPAHGIATCAAASCGFTCTAGFHACGAVCADDSSPLTCGTSCTPCVAPANAMATCAAGACGFACNAGFEAVGSVCSPAAPRPVAPLSTATVTSRRPTLRWSLVPGTTGAQVELCRDRACTTTLTTLTGATSAVPTTDLPSGVVYWRLRGIVGADVGLVPGPTWELVVGARSAAIDTSFGSTADVDGDGYADVLVGASGANSATGAAYEYPGSAAGVSTTPGFVVGGPDGYGGNYGESIASAGDVNGDGFADVIVGAGNAASLRGRAYVYFGSAAGLSRTAATTLTGPSTPGSEFGISVASAGDVNRDGYADVLVGADRDAFGAGRVYLYLGSASGLSTTPVATLAGSGDSSGYFGNAVASAGDVNADGYADVVIGARGEMFGTGRVYLYLGSSSGLATTPAVTLTGLDGSTGNFGSAVAGVGDVDGDGRSDVIASAPNGGSGGNVYVFLGTSTGIVATPSRVLSRASGSSSSFAESIAGAGDVNGDGYGDVLVGVLASGFGNDEVLVFFGGAAGLSTTAGSIVFSPDGSGQYFGTASASAGDVDRDGFADVIVGEWRVNSAGRAFVFHGSASGVSASATTTLNGPPFSSSDFGRAVGGAAW
jgi:hypothetical protein